MERSEPTDSLDEENDESLITSYAYAAFAGGGGRAYVHIGGLAALNDLGVRIIRVAGTSAGAVIAALVSVGYSANEIFNPRQPHEHLLKQYGYNSITELFEKKSWTRFKRLLPFARTLLGEPLGEHAPSSLREKQFWGWLSTAGHLGVLVLRNLHHLLFCGLPLFGTFLFKLGVIDTHLVARVLDDMLRDRINKLRSEFPGGLDPIEKNDVAWVRFRDIKETPGCMLLKIVVTDLARNRVVLFSSEDTPDVAVVDAVIASASFPGVFFPREVSWIDGVKGRVYTDGGLTSNLPVWVFADERRRDVRRGLGLLPTIGFTFEEERPEDAEGLGLRAYLLRIKDALTSTSQKIVHGYVDNLILVELPCKGISVFDMDVRVSKMVQIVDHAHDVTTAILGKRILTGTGALKVRALVAAEVKRFRERDGAPAAIEPGGAYDPAAARRPVETLTRSEQIYFALLLARELILDALDPEDRRNCGRLRTCLIQPVEALYRRAPILNFRITQAVGFAKDADDRLFLDAENRGAPLAFKIGKPTFWHNNAVEAYMSKYERSLIPPTLKSAYCIPVFFDGIRATSSLINASEPQIAESPVGVFSLDSDLDLERCYEIEWFRVTLVHVGRVIGDILKDMREPN